MRLPATYHHVLSSSTPSAGSERNVSLTKVGSITTLDHAARHITYRIDHNALRSSIRVHFYLR